MPRKVLVTGASGFIGSAIIDYGLTQGDQMYAGIRKSSSRKYLSDPNIQFSILDFENQESLNTLLQLEQFDCIIHTAGLTKTKEYEDYHRVNCTYLERLIKAIELSQKESSFIFLSSLAAIGPGDLQENGRIDHDSIPQPVTAYGRSKLAAEQFLNQSSFENYTIFRPTAVYGPREKDLFTVFNLLNKRLELLIGGNKQELSFVYVSDLVKVIYTASTKLQSGLSYFISDGDIHSAEALNLCIKKHLNKKSLKIKLPVKFVRFLAAFLEKIGDFTGKYPALNKEKLRELECLSWNCDIRSLEKDYGFVPEYNLENGTRETVQWYKNNNWL